MGIHIQIVKKYIAHPGNLNSWATVNFPATIVGVYKNGGSISDTNEAEPTQLLENFYPRAAITQECYILRRIGTW